MEAHLTYEEVCHARRKEVKESTGRGKKHRYSAEFKVTAVKMAAAPEPER